MDHGYHWWEQFQTRQNSCLLLNFDRKHAILQYQFFTSAIQSSFKWYEETILGVAGWPSLWANVFQVFSTNSRKNNDMMAKPFLSLLLWGYTKAITTSCARPTHVAESGPLAQLQGLQNSGSWMIMLTLLTMLRVKTLSALHCYW